MLSYGKIVIIINFTVLFDIDIRNLTNACKSGVAHNKSIFYFWLPLASELFILPKTGVPVNFLVVSNNWTAANFEHCEEASTFCTVHIVHVPGQEHAVQLSVALHWLCWIYLRIKNFYFSVLTPL